MATCTIEDLGGPGVGDCSASKGQTLSEIAAREWDVIVIGSGLGGGTAGRRLAEQGASVLFLERGPSRPIQRTSDPIEDIVDPQMRHKHGLWPTPLNGTINGKTQLFLGPVGSGVGGSSAYYAATLERPERWDIDDSRARPHPTGGWPVRYDDFVPYFQEAERRFFVTGRNDPLSPDEGELREPPEFEGGDKAMVERFRKRGLHPYRLHMGVRLNQGCDWCFGRVCERRCKMDGRSAGVEPALAFRNVSLLDMCDVRALRGKAGSVTHVEVEKDGELFALRARRYIVAAGGFGSPRLLLASKSEQWPNGCGNSSGLVGRNLMFHLLESIAIWPGRGARFNGPTKAITFRDLYYHKGNRYGAVQAVGLDAGYGEVSYAFRKKMYRIGLRGLTGKLSNIPALILSKLLGTAKVYRAIIEDLPYPENRVLLDEEDPQRIKFQYTMPDELVQRHKQFRHLLRSRLRRQPVLFLTDEAELDISHTCGTVRFGSDPRTSVVNADCRFHDIDNLYIADASFMPTSAGINPGLLVAANALRVADIIGRSLRLVRSQRLPADRAEVDGAATVFHN